MNYGLYLSAGGALSSMHRLDVLANNLANVNTVGFKPDLVASRQRLPERLESGGDFADPQRLLEQLGGGTLAHPTRVDLAAGALEPTGNPLDIAIDGDGFLVVRAGEDRGPESLRLTRDGRLARDTQGRLVLGGSGQPVLDERDREIRIPRDTPIEIADDGTIHQDGRVLARLRLVSADESNLAKDGHALLRLRDGDPSSLRAGSGRILQQHLEQSAVDPVLALNNLINATKAVQANAQMMQYHDHILGQTINTFGRVT